MRIQDSVRQRLLPLFSEEQIGARVKELGAECLKLDLHEPLAIPILKGSFMFAADLLRAMHHVGLEPEVEFMMLSSYRGEQSSGQVIISKDIEGGVEGRDVILIDDILETGRTLAFARDLLTARGAKRVLICCLLEKPGKRAVDVKADLIGFSCPDHFVVGYGMDINHSFRQLPFIGHIPQGEF